MRIIEVCFLTVVRCALIGAVIGGALHWTEGDGCMIPAPIPGIFYAIIWGAGGAVMGLLLSPAAIVIEQKRKVASDDVRQSKMNHVNVNTFLVRPSFEPGDMLVRPSDFIVVSAPEQLLRMPTDRELPGQQGP